MIESGDRVLLGFSGGIDSATLLDILHHMRKNLPFDLGVAHVNHLLRGEESERDEDFTRAIARGYDIPYHVKRIDVKEYARARGISAQHAGRDIRYSFFNELSEMQRYTKIAIAHNLDDQVETFLLRLAKGTGIRGLSSIPPVRDKIIRPFLTTFRAEIEAYALSHSIRYVVDSSNEKVKYERNFIRHKVMPVLRELNPSFDEKVVSVLGDISRINGIFEEKKRSFMECFVEKRADGICIPIGDLRHLDEEVRFRVLSDVFASIVPFSLLREHMRLIEKIIKSPRPNLSLDLPFSVRIVRSYDILRITTEHLPPKTAEIWPLDQGSNTLLSLGVEVDLRTVENPGESYPDDALTAWFDLNMCEHLTVRTYRAGDRFVPLGMASPVKLKDFFISRKIPREARYRIPLIMSNENIIWVVGHRIDERYRVKHTTDKVLEIAVKKTCQPL